MDTSLTRERQAWSDLPARSLWTPWILGVIGLAGAAIYFRKAIVSLVDAWTTIPEYNHGPIIPFIAAFILWRDLSRIQQPKVGGYSSIILIVAALLLGAINVVGPSTFPAVVGLYLWICGFVIAYQGERRARAAWAGLVYLAFALPLAIIVFRDMQAFMQHVSSVLGVQVVRLFDVPVYLEGNVLDFGAFKLQVAEACSGLRYLFPMASFGFLCSYLFIGGRWQKIVIFLSTVPIAILMNSFRIGVTGLLVNWSSIEAAEGFIHAFEGWVIFCGCIAVLFLEMKLLCYLDSRGHSLIGRLDFSIPELSSLRVTRARPMKWTPVVVGVTTVCAMAALAFGITSERVPDRSSFDTFPRTIGTWEASDALLDPEQATALQTSDYLSLDYVSAPGTEPVNVWIPYYATQRDGSAAHSPILCIPAGGWVIEQSDRATLTVPGFNDGKPFQANRFVISKDGSRQLVYYWFQGRGRIEQDEYAVKMSLVVDSVRLRRTDGALVRFVTPVAPDATGLAKADQRLQDFLGVFAPNLGQYLPQ